MDTGCDLFIVLKGYILARYIHITVIFGFPKSDYLKDDVILKTVIYSWRAGTAAAAPDLKQRRTIHGFESALLISKAADYG